MSEDRSGQQDRIRLTRLWFHKLVISRTLTLTDAVIFERGKRKNREFPSCSSILEVGGIAKGRSFKTQRTAADGERRDGRATRKHSRTGRPLTERSKQCRWNREDFRANPTVWFPSSTPRPLTHTFEFEPRSKESFHGHREIDEESAVHRAVGKGGTGTTPQEISPREH